MEQKHDLKQTCNKKLFLICIWITRETIGITGMSLGGFRLYFVFLKLNFWSHLHFDNTFWCCILSGDHQQNCILHKLPDNRNTLASSMPSLNQSRWIENGDAILINFLNSCKLTISFQKHWDQNYHQIPSNNRFSQKLENGSNACIMMVLKTFQLSVSLSALLRSREAYFKIQFSYRSMQLSSNSKSWRGSLTFFLWSS